MKATGFLWDAPGLSGAWAKLTQALIFAALRREPRATKARSAGWFDRLDGWFWRQAQRDQEAYLAGSRDIFTTSRNASGVSSVHTAVASIDALRRRNDER
jgi:hypothetical protein